MNHHRHIPVLLTEVLDLMRWEKPIDVLVDLTCGGGGHLKALLEHFSRPKQIIAFDQDPLVLSQTRAKLLPYDPIEYHHENFSKFPELGIQADRILLDLGVSSFQLDDASRGFSFRQEGPLDMRMNPTKGEAAWEFLEHCDEKELADILKNYGEERKANLFASRFVRERAKKSIRSTKDFVEALGFHLDSRNRKGRHPLTRVFQALRIHVNQEFEVLESILGDLPDLLKKNGRLAIITFHSLEDRAVKWALKARLSPINKKVIRASLEEQSENPRARSAKLRVYEKEGIPDE